MNTLWPSRSAGESSSDDKGSEESIAKPAEDAPETNVADVGPEHESFSSSSAPPAVSSARPSLTRNAATPTMPAPPASMPPPPPEPQPATDSLSLVQLRRLVAEFNKPEPIVYDFDYKDSGAHEEEIDEWFAYQFWQWVRLNAAQAAFESQWEPYQRHTAWEKADEATKTSFVRERLDSLSSSGSAERLDAARSLLYLALGRWADTASPTGSRSNERSAASPAQLGAIKSEVKFFTSIGGYGAVWKAIQNCFQLFWSDDAHQQPESLNDAHDELFSLMTVIYLAIEETLNDTKELEATRTELVRLNPNLVNYLSIATSKIRWDESNALPLTQILLLLWKSVLLVFGGTSEIAEAKKAVSETGGEEKSQDVISASPLDYHVFRQELTSKYPSYVPPQPKIPIEPDNTTLLPPLQNQPAKNSSNGILPGPPNAQSGGASILNQPVHIATPAPSPPPSPGLGGKGGKKQNYQTNQNFPFMYPPLDSTSNSAGGKGPAGLQDALVGRKWQGSDIPASILEAGELFSKRVRMSRATRQMWDEREKFMRSERGWDQSRNADADQLGLGPDLDPEVDLDLDLSELSLEERELIAEAIGRTEKRKEGGTNETQAESEIDLGPNATVDDAVKQRLVLVENFYRELLPHLQSLVIMLLRPIYVTVSIVSQNPPAQQHSGMAGRGVNTGPGGGGGPARQQQQQQDPSSAVSGPSEPPDMSPEEVDATRTREIMTKAATGTLLLILKWLKLSHVLRFEFVTQLLLDHNYLPLILKLFAHQDIQQLVDCKTDRIENSFFHFCNLRSKVKDSPPAAAAGKETSEVDEPEDEGSEDEAAPPPIKRQRSPPGPESRDAKEAEQGAPEGPGTSSARPEVDELGYPVNPLPHEPITDFSRRNFFTLINYLRIMQKICKRKAHRNLLLVQYKSSNILRKSLKVPQPTLRLYTLKLFKNQVPYCGRKWRQSNMRVITAVYLHVRPELRDEWLAGSDVDAEVDSSLPLEQALRSLTHWFNVRRYPEQHVGGDEELRAAYYREEQGFFARELEKLGMAWQDAAAAAGGNPADDGGNSTF